MNIDKIIAGSAMGISVIALCVSIWQGIVTREHNRLSVKPKFIVTPLLEGHGGKNGIYISNDGLGPGIITNATITINDKDYNFSKNPWPTALNDMNLKPICFAMSWLPIGAALKASEEKALIEITRTDLDGCYIETMNLIARNVIKVTINYKSMYDENDQISNVVSLGKDDFNFSKMIGL